MIEIKLLEQDNQLSAKAPYKEIVCGNANYKISVEFTSDWIFVKNKIAIFVIDDKKTAVKFANSEINVPALPNALSAKLVIISAENEERKLVTEPFELSLKPTLHVEDMKEFKPLTGYVNEVLAKLKGLTEGTIKAKLAEIADTALVAETAKLAETAGTATIAQNVSNPSLLINGDFRVNQRGSSTYTCTKNEYTIDRWMGASGLTVTKNANSVTIANTNTSGSVLFQQKLEESYSSFAGKTLTLSAEIAGEIYSLTTTLPLNAPSSATTISTKEITSGASLTLTYFSSNILSAGVTLPAGASLTITYLKLELGTTPTLFTPRTTAEELTLCQRYYQEIRLQGGAITASNSSSLYPVFPLCTTLRIKPTTTVNPFPAIRGNLQQLTLNSTNCTITINSIWSASITIAVIVNTEFFSPLEIYSFANGTAKLDAEIY